MEGKANIQIGHVNNKAKQKVTLTYYLGPFDSVEEAQTAKYALDVVAEAFGAEVHEDALIIGEVVNEKSKNDATKKTDKVKDKVEAIIEQ